MRTLRIYSLNNFPLHQSVMLPIVTMLYIISLGLTYLVTGSLYLLTTLFLILPPPYTLTFVFIPDNILCPEVCSVCYK